jgi:hypothetical protein
MNRFRSEQNDWTPLHVCACWNKSDSLRLLLLNGADPFLADHVIATPKNSRKFPKNKIINKILSIYKNGQRALDIAAENSSHECIRILNEFIANTHVHNRQRSATNSASHNKTRTVSHQIEQQVEQLTLTRCTSISSVSSLGDVSALSFSNMRTSTFDDESKFEQQLAAESNLQKPNAQKRPQVPSNTCALKPPVAMPPPPPQTPPVVPPHPHRPTQPKVAVSPRVTNPQTPPLTASDREEIEEIISTIIDLKLDMKQQNKRHASEPNTPLMSKNRLNRPTQTKLDQDMLHQPFKTAQNQRHVSDSTTQTKITSDRFLNPEPSNINPNLAKCLSPKLTPNPLSYRSNGLVDRETQTTGRMVKLQNSATKPETGNVISNTNNPPVALPANVMEELSSRLSTQRERQQRTCHENNSNNRESNDLMMTSNVRNANLAPVTNVQKTTNTPRQVSKGNIFDRSNHVEESPTSNKQHSSPTTLNGRIRSWLSNRLGSSSWLLSPTHTNSDNQQTSEHIRYFISKIIAK